MCRGPALEAYGKLNFDTLESAIIRYVVSMSCLFKGTTLVQLVTLSHWKVPLPDAGKCMLFVQQSYTLKAFDQLDSDTLGGQ